MRYECCEGWKGSSRLRRGFFCGSQCISIDSLVIQKLRNRDERMLYSCDLLLISILQQRAGIEGEKCLFSDESGGG